MPATLTTIAGVTKEIYEPPLRMQLQEDTVTIKRLERTSRGVTDHVGGKYVTFPVHYQRNAGIGARKEREVLPLAGFQGTAAAQVGLKYEYGAIELSGQLFELVDKEYQTFISAVDIEMQGLRRDLAKDQNRQVFGNGTGVIATSSSTGTGTTVTISSGLYNLQQGEILDVFATGAITEPLTPKAQVTILSVDWDATTGQVVLAAAPAAALAAGDQWVRAGSANREWTGLGAIITNTGLLYNINPTTVNVWKAVVDDPGSPRALAENQVIRNVDKVRLNGGKVSLLVSSLGVRRAYWNLLVQQRQFSNTKEFTGGFSGLAFTTDQGEVPWISDPDAPPNTVYGISESSLKIYQSGDWSFMARDGSMWDRVPGKDAYGAVMYRYSELGCDRRNANFIMKNVIEA